MSVFQPRHQALPQGAAEVSQPRLAVPSRGEMREEDWELERLDGTRTTLKAPIESDFCLGISLFTTDNQNI